MPRSVRNFWLAARIDGRPSPLRGGPRGKDGGFELAITVRDGGTVAEALRVVGRVLSDGHLALEVCDPQGRTVHSLAVEP